MEEIEKQEETINRLIDSAKKYIVPTAIIIGIAMIGYNLFGNTPENKIKKYQKDIEEKGYHITIAENDNIKVVTEYVKANKIEGENEEIFYTVAEGFTLMEDEYGNYIGVKIYEVHQLADGTEIEFPKEINIPFEQTLEEMDEQIIRKLG